LPPLAGWGTASSELELVLNLWPHLLQNLKFAGGFAPQLGQVTSSEDPHSPQNSESAGFSKPHSGHCMMSPLNFDSHYVKNGSEFNNESTSD